MTTELLPADQSALVTFDRGRVAALPVLARTESCVDEALARRDADGETALVDGVFAGMMVGESDVGRSLLMVFSDGLDTASFLTADRVLDIGRRSDVVVYPITTKGARPDFLEELAELTGGRLHEVGAQRRSVRRPSGRSSTSSAIATWSPTRRRTCRRTAGTSSRCA